MKKMFVFISLFFLAHLGFTQSMPDSSVLSLRAPDTFQVEFQTTAGSFTVKAHRDWSPAGVDRLYQLVKSEFFKDVALFRVQPEYVVQFGISDEPKVNDFWEEYPLPDEPVRQSNLKGTVAYAREGAESRTTQLFINYQDNLKLDTINFNGLRGFPPVGKVVKGMEVIESFYSDYGFEPAEKQDSIYELGNAYLIKHYPGLDYVEEARVVND